MAEEQGQTGVTDGASSSAGVRVAYIAGAIAVTVLVLWGAAHVVIPPLYPDRPAPPGHYSGPCWACHLISKSAPIGKAR